MEESKDSPKPKTPEKKSAPQSNNLLWYLLGLGVLLLLLVTVWGSQNKRTISWSNFEKLIEASNPKAPEGTTTYIIHVDDSTKPATRWKLDQPRDLRIGSTEVTGTVMAMKLPGSDDASKPGGISAAESTDPQRIGFRVPNRPAAEERLLALLDENNIEDYTLEDAPSALLGYLPLLILTGMFVMLMVVMLRRMGGAGSPMAFGRSRGKLIAQDDIEVTFDDVAGIEEAVDELREVVDFLKNPERYHRLGGRIPKGVLLVGPPGTGKTLLAKAVAGEAGVPFFSLSGSDFVEMFVGVGAARVRDMFQQAEQRAPCIVFIDELDALGKTRGSGQIGGHDEREQTLNALLVEMDGFGTNSGIIIMAATNRPETLDPALLRPGRFDRHVLVDRPDVSGREEILEVHLQKIKVDEDVNVKQVAAITSGFVGADLANIVNEAALLAARNGKKAVGMQELNEAVERSSAGLEKKSRIMQPEEKLRVAYHESGHALVAYSLPNTDPVHKVSIIPRGLAALGYTMQRPEQDRFLMTKSELESRIQVLLAGTVAEEMVFEDISSGAQNDLERATEIARSMVMDFGMSRLGRVNFRESHRSPFLATGGDFGRGSTHSEHTAREIDEEVKRILGEMLERVRQILAERRQSLEAVTKSLMELETIDSEMLKQIIDETTSGARIVPGTAAEPKRPSRIKTDEPPEKDASAGM
jgi:cell division protease FtsH